MLLDATAIASLVLVGIAGLILLLVGLTRNARLPARLAWHNIRGARGRTVLLLLGLLVGTTIISGSLVINDTVGAVNVHYALQNYGFIDEAVYNVTPSGAYRAFSPALYDNLSASVSGNRWISALSPEAIGVTEAFDHRSGIPETNLDLVGADGNATTAQGPFHANGGAALRGPSPGKVFLDDQAAQQLDARVGDAISLYGPSGNIVNVTVEAVVQDDTRGGVFYLYFGQAGNVFIDLAGGQSILQLGSAINFIAVTNPGDQLTGAANSANASDALNASLAHLANPVGVTVHSLLRSAIDAAVASGASTATFFFVFGTFSIVAGAVLVVTIFVMLAEERKGEMGTLRAIGLRRGQMVLVYLFEGVIYSAGSAVAGTFLGVGVGYIMAWAFSVIFGVGQISASVILDSFTFTASSLVLAFSIGFLLTLVTVAVASYRVSRLNIVRAIRSIPEPPPTAQEYTRIAYLGIPLAALGALLLATTARGSSEVSIPLTAFALLVVGAGLVAARFFRNRYVFSTVGAILLVWAGVGPIRTAVLGSGHTGSILSVLVLGFMLVLGAILVYVFNASFLVQGLTRLFGGSPRRVAIANTGLAYPGRRPVRPAMTLSIFTLVVFVVVVVAGYGSSLEANLESHISAQTGGYSFFGAANAPIPGVAATVRGNATLAPEISQVVPIVGGSAYLHYAGLPAQAKLPYSVFAAQTGQAGQADFYAGNQFSLQSRLGGLSDRSAWEEIGSNDSTVIVDGGFAASGFGQSLPPLQVGKRLTIANPVTGNVSNLTVIGVMQGSLLPGVWVNAQAAKALGITQVLDALFTVAPGANSVHAAQDLKRAFFPQGLVVYDFGQILGQTISSFQAVLSLLEIFAALGLAVGIAAMGIIALRAVAERRREIGMARASGFKQVDVFLSFLLEYSFIALLGIGLGVALALLLDYEASNVSGNGLTFTIPWATVGLIVVISYALTVAATGGPALRAARMPPSEATRYTE